MIFDAVRSREDGHIQTKGSSLFSSADVPPQGVAEMLTRQNFKNEGLFGFKNTMKYTEKSFDVNEQIAVLGVIRDGFDSQGAPVKIMDKVRSIPQHPPVGVHANNLVSLAIYIYA